MGNSADANESTSEGRPQGLRARLLAELRQSLGGSASDRAAFVISALTSPFLVCTVVGAVLAANLAGSWREVALWGMLAALFAGVVPFVVVFLMLVKGRVADIHVAERERRWVPLGAAVGSGVLAVVALHLLHAPRGLQALGAAYLVNAAAFAFVSLHWKISVHSGVYSGAFAACALVLGPWWWLALAALPLVVRARSRRGRHSVWQGIAGAAMATALTAATYLIVTAF